MSIACVGHLTNEQSDCIGVFAYTSVRGTWLLDRWPLPSTSVSSLLMMTTMCLLASWVAHLVLDPVDIAQTLQRPKPPINVFFSLAARYSLVLHRVPKSQRKENIDWLS